ncbi:hypothetical protein HAX54_019395 [Datura stramonium]|uniref:Uncharacterized protein n=1 Tax=Datura stramonium TaxID=4076 RepID=A0ABS8Y8J9_DATST|nr:hypothetical protein [Datura stramonium]
MKKKSGGVRPLVTIWWWRRVSPEREEEGRGEGQWRRDEGGEVTDINGGCYGVLRPIMARSNGRERRKIGGGFGCFLWEKREGEEGDGKGGGLVLFLRRSSVAD